MNEVKVGQVYRDKRVRKAGEPERQIKVVSVGEFTAYVRNTRTNRLVNVETARLLSDYRFELVSEIGSLAPAPERETSLAASAS